MSNVVLVFFVELVFVHSLQKAFAPKGYRLFYREAEHLRMLHTSEVGQNGKGRTLRNKPYCNRPKCFKWSESLSSLCRLRMHRGKCFCASSSIISAVIPSASVASEAPAHSDGAPAKKPCERFDSIGTRRESSSSRGRALAVNCKGTYEVRK